MGLSVATANHDVSLTVGQYRVDIINQLVSVKGTVSFIWVLHCIEYIKEQLESAGYNVTLQHFEVNVNCFVPTNYCITNTCLSSGPSLY